MTDLLRWLTGAAALWLLTPLVVGAAEIPVLRGLADLTPAERAELERGKPVLAAVRTPTGEGAQALFLVDTEVSQTYALLVDYESFPRWMHSVKAITMVTWTEPATALVGIVIPSPLQDVSYVMRRSHVPLQQVTWTRESGDLKAVDGGYEFSPYGDRTLVRYHAVVDIGTWVPAFVKRHFTTQGLQGLIESIQREARRRYPRIRRNDQ